MVTLENVNKYFFRKKKNEIHAINGTSLDMQEAQLVALLGPSGCGKTTMLNAIGGLDKIDSGSIYVDGEKISGRMSGTVDRIRTLKIGYIFQNYNLIDNMTVSENVAIALQMIGMKNKREIQDNVEYVLEKVGMYRYRNRRADMLSGGERQRVGIARAIVKNPQIIIADEPTGNLDSRNTLEVMNIIKSISRERLVILVTHEEELANFYADRIIRIKDGTVESDVSNTGSHLNYHIDNRIYLKEIQDHQKLNTGRYDIDFYNRGGDLNINIIVDNGKVYIQPKDGSRVEVVDETSAVEVIDDYDRGMSAEEMDRQAIELKRLDSFAKQKYTSILNPWTLLKRGFKTIASYPLMKKILLVGFFLSAVVITLSVSIYGGVFKVDESKYTTSDKDYLIVSGKQFTPEIYEGYENSELVQYMMPGDSQINMKLDTDTLYQMKSATVTFAASLSDVGKLKKEDIYAGRMPKAAHEIVIDKTVIQKKMKGEGWTDARQLGIEKVQDLLDRSLSVKNMDPYIIVGIVDRKTPCIYTQQSDFLGIVNNSYPDMDSEEYYEDMAFEEEMSEDGEEDGGEDGSGDLVDLTLKYREAGLAMGSWPKTPYEVMTNYWTSKDSKKAKIGMELNRKVNGQKLKICGYYSDRNMNSTYLLADAATIKIATIESKKKATLCPSGSKEELMEQLEADGFKPVDPNERAREAYFKSHMGLMRAIMIVSIIMLAISFTEIFLMIRTSFLSRIKEVGTYRAIGVKKIDIYKMFSGEIIAISLIASMPGFILTCMTLSKIVQRPTLADNFLYNGNTVIISLIFIFALNLFFGLLPVWRTIRKTPAAILARTDVN